MWLADRHSDQELYTAAKHCAKIHLVQLNQTDEFLNLPLRLLVDIIKGECWRLKLLENHLITRDHKTPRLLILLHSKSDCLNGTYYALFFD